VSISLADVDCAEVDLALDEYLSGSTGECPDQHESVLMAEAEDTPPRRSLGRGLRIAVNKGTALILMLLDRLRAVALSSINNRILGQPFGHVNLKSYLTTRQKLIDGALDIYLPKANRKPATLHRAMRYSLFAGGKRLRPILCLATAEACRGKIDDALPLACAIECIHTYSLVHDDLPSMDDDDFRRGRPTCHKVFGEGIAVLAGDALLTIAFEIVSRARPRPRYDVSTLLREVAVAAGSQKLIAGQVADLEAEGKNVKRRELQFIHENKTAAILRSAVRLGAMSANANPRKLAATTQFGERLGLAFQIIDDILDVTQTSEILGKSAGKDVAAKKATYPAVIGLRQSRAETRRLTHEAHNALSVFNDRDGETLYALANYLLEREY
jgi:geranylgeranyl diphosphate synthase, type II